MVSYPSYILRSELFEAQSSDRRGLGGYSSPKCWSFPRSCKVFRAYLRFAARFASFLALLFCLALAMVPVNFDREGCRR